MNLKEAIIAVLMPSIKAIGTLELAELIGKLKAKKPELYPDFIKGMYSDFIVLKELAAETDTKVDDGMVEMVLSALTAAASADNIVL